ncbi:hypothetical protein IFM89_036617 [Coptis chinensis]|uniref:DUF4283 domain-containing protein n=1 Tax=Coptis chinensis TaxID=261450 RepID=A0A835LPZ2_9MAGN|nr:hypothetical protein IFM89_036617 [Coptis chinensis]
MTFADKVKANVTMELDISELPLPGLKGNIPSIRIPQKALERGLNFYKFSLVLDFQKIKLEVVRAIAAETWRPRGSWKIVQLGKEYFMIRLTCGEDFVKIWSGGPWKFENQILRPSKWDPGFDLDIQRILHAMVATTLESGPILDATIEQVYTTVASHDRATSVVQVTAAAQVQDTVVVIHTTTTEVAMEKEDHRLDYSIFYK